MDANDNHLLGTPQAGVVIVVGLIVGSATLIGVMTASALAVIVVAVTAALVAALLGGGGWLAGGGGVGRRGARIR
ncbi:hypothetical protein [Rhodococcus daqingensis]|uniref:Uncharacterized protein n=1 Tax=Rhodococcus daqingensis TaxID=2479363 RepID=A0ABW2RUJ7_9NOCA